MIPELARMFSEERGPAFNEIRIPVFMVVARESSGGIIPVHELTQATDFHFDLRNSLSPEMKNRTDFTNSVHNLIKHRKTRSERSHIKTRN
jgi:hypothetical protein